MGSNSPSSILLKPVGVVKNFCLSASFRSCTDITRYSFEIKVSYGTVFTTLFADFLTFEYPVLNND